MKDFIVSLFDRIRQKNPKELKALFLSVILSLIVTILFQIYMKKKSPPFLTREEQHVTPNRE